MCFKIYCTIVLWVMIRIMVKVYKNEVLAWKIGKIKTLPCIVSTFVLCSSLYKKGIQFKYPSRLPNCRLNISPQITLTCYHQHSLQRQREKERMLMIRTDNRFKAMSCNRRVNEVTTTTQREMKHKFTKPKQQSRRLWCIHECC